MEPKSVGPGKEIAFETMPEFSAFGSWVSCASEITTLTPLRTFVGCVPSREGRFDPASLHTRQEICETHCLALTLALISG